jgi:hypothetical protein
MYRPKICFDLRRSGQVIVTFALLPGRVFSQGKKDWRFSLYVCDIPLTVWANPLPHLIISKRVPLATVTPFLEHIHVLRIFFFSD